MSEEDIIKEHSYHVQRVAEHEKLQRLAFEKVARDSLFKQQHPKIKLSDMSRRHLDDWLGVYASVLCVLLLFLALAWIGQRQDWISGSAQIERLRIDAGRVNAKMAEDVAGQVSQWNQTIAKKQRWRHTIFRFLIPSGWDNTEPIDMPVEQ